MEYETRKFFKCVFVIIPGSALRSYIGMKRHIFGILEGGPRSFCVLFENLRKGGTPLESERERDPGCEYFFNSIHMERDDDDGAIRMGVL